MKNLGIRTLLSLLAAGTGLAVAVAVAQQQPSPSGAASITAAPAAAATVAAPASASAGDPRPALAKKIPGTKADDFRQSPIPGVWELARGAEIIYVTADGRYAFAGDLYEIPTDTNLSERRRRDARLELIKSVPESQMVVFAPKDPKYTITVFTDIDCGYCRKLHSEIAKYNELGIRVRYLFFPRTGPDTESWDKAVAVWCSPNRNDALTRAKRGEAIKLAKCGTTPVDHDYELGQEIGLRGTPAILLANGDMLPGYVPPATLAKRLQSIGR
ncbi:MAG: DsbC family protein [Steroidobacteraceae bacterium]|nr:DsbC family protein [Nevskiaceae bacterium]MCP5360484.1 DsbC family protein [Nevskiaceae bacterium]MCP5467564.1 DsbC family protein [Nevskiaceae bacterium]MCP5472830.1 DsbC family protein [Nevskiaceae bacterium]